MGKFSLDDKVKTILADPRAVKIIEEYIPGASHHPQLFIINNKKVGTLLHLGHLVGLTPDQVEEIRQRVEALE